MASPRTPANAVAWARVPRTGFGGLCLKHTRMAYNIPAMHSNARTAWQQARHRHVGANLAGIRVGAPVFLDRSTSRHGHVATWLGGGMIATTDSTSTHTRVDPLTRWTNAGWRVLGWTEDLNGIRVLPATGGSTAVSRYRSNANGVNVRTAPSTSARVVRQLRRGEEFTVPRGSGTVAGSGRRWFTTTRGNFVAAEFVTRIG